MARWRRKLAITCAKFASKVIHKLNKRGGSTLPGYIAWRIDPDILPFLVGQIREKVIVTMGTNGKTTVNNFLCHVFLRQEKKVVINRTGSNMLNGIVSAFVLAADKTGGMDADYACIEVDEFAALHLLPQLKPDCIILTNIFRDQLDRYGEVDTVCSSILKAFLSVPDAKLVINCDDVLSSALIAGCSNTVITYGINEPVFDSVTSPEIHESTFCRFCGGKLEYDFFHYGQLGTYHCPHCGWERPEPDCHVENIVFEENGYCFDIDSLRIHSGMDSPYNIYNILSVYAALYGLGLAAEGVQDAAATFDYGNDREELFTINDTKVQLYLAKNPVGFQQKIAMLLKDGKPKDILIQVNDTDQDGKDISWLWDVDFRYLRDVNASTITVTGSRRHDMALRLKYENISCNAVRNMLRRLKQLSLNGTGNIYIIVNYSGLMPVNHMLSKLQNGERRHDSRAGKETG